MAYYLYNGTADTTYTNGANWTVGGTTAATFPTTSDTADFPSAVTNSITTGLNVATNVLANLIINQNFTGYLGDGTNYLQLGATQALIGIGSGPGSGRLMLNYGTNANITTIYNSSNLSVDAGKEPIRLLANSQSTIFYILGGVTGIATNTDGETSNISSFNVDVSQGGGATLDIGPGVTINNGSSTSVVTQLGGNVNAEAIGGTVTYNQSSGNLTLFTTSTLGTGAANVGTLNANGTCLMNAPGTINNLNVLGNGIANFTQYPAPRIVGNCSAVRGATILLNNGNVNSVTLTNGVVLNGCRLEDIVLDTWFGNTIKLS